MKTIRLQRGAWKFDPTKRLGRRGGFGEVFEGVDEGGVPIAVKRLHVGQEDAGHRELRIASELAGHSYRHVIPILDSGADADSSAYFVVMARAERSLQDFIAARRAIPEKESIEILSQIVAGLIEIEDIVHRDLKPDNVLLHGGRWKLADLGIAKFVEESTSVNTLKDCLSAPYAAPEQWNLDGVSKKTDVYALGCIVHALITGMPPFSGNSMEEYRRKHLDESPRRLSVSGRLSQLVSMCLRKNPEGRPDLASVQAQLQGAMLDQVNQRHSELASVGAVVAEEQARRETEAQKALRAEKARRQLAKEGIEALVSTLTNLADEIKSAAPIVKDIRMPFMAGVLGSRSRFEVTLGSGGLTCSVCFPYIEADRFKESGWDVAAGGLIEVVQNSNSYAGRSANLWFMKMPGDGGFRWWEVTYMSTWGGSNHRSEPFGFSAEQELRHADLAASTITHSYQLAARVTPIDGEFEDAFVRRWVRRLALAAKSSLERPSSLPEQ